MTPDEKDETTTDDIEEASEETPEEGEEDSEEGDEDGEEEDLQAICGVAILMDFDGKGISFIPIPVEGKKVERTATGSDIINLICSAYAHVNANLAVDKLLANLNAMSRKKKGNRIIHPGARI